MAAWARRAQSSFPGQAGLGELNPLSYTEDRNQGGLLYRPPLPNKPDISIHPTQAAPASARDWASRGSEPWRRPAAGRPAGARFELLFGANPLENLTILKDFSEDQVPGWT